MAIFIAAALGNMLALCIHDFVWRLRATCLDFLLVLGGFVALFYNVVLFSIWSYNDTGSMMPVAWWHSLMTFAFVLPFFVGVWHRFNSEMRQVSLVKSTLAFYAEIGIFVVCFFAGTTLLFLLLTSFPFVFRIAPLMAAFIVLYGATWLACAFFRKQLISAWRFARQSLKP